MKQYFELPEIIKFILNGIAFLAFVFLVAWLADVIWSEVERWRRK